MLLRMFIVSARLLRPSTGASPATLLAVVLGLVSESWVTVSLCGGLWRKEWWGKATYCVVWRILVVLRLHC